MKAIIFLFLSFLIFFTGCKTQEQIRREQMVDSMAQQMRQGQKVSANITVEISELKKQILQLQGMIEETGQNEQTSREGRLVDLQSRVNLLEEKNKTLGQQIEEQNQSISDLKNQLAEQGKYLKNLLKTLKKINSPVATKKQKPASAYDVAMKAYRNGQYSKARPLLKKLADKKLSAKLDARVVHNLAMTEYMLKNDENALVYFSKLYSTYPNSNFNAGGLLFMAKTFQRQKRVDEAKATLNELITKFPKSKRATEAKKILKTL